MSHGEAARDSADGHGAEDHRSEGGDELDASKRRGERPRPRSPCCAERRSFAHHAAVPPFRLVPSDLVGSQEVEHERHSCDGPYVPRIKHIIEHEPHHPKLDQASERASDQASTDAEVEDETEDRIEGDKGEGEPDVGVCERDGR